MHNSEFNGMPRWKLSVAKCPATKGFVGLEPQPKPTPATTPKEREQRVKFVDITTTKRDK